MERFLVEVSHGSDMDSCKEATHVFMNSGSHFMTHADYGCDDDVHKSWMIVELEDRAMALSMLPPAFRARAEIVKLSSYASPETHEAMENHGNE